MARKKRSIAPVKLSFNYTDYRPDILMTKPEKELRKEYSRLRSIARKRLERIAETKYVTSATYKYNAGVYIPLSAVSNKNELSALLASVIRFLTAKTGSLTGLKEATSGTIETLHESGYTWIDEENLRLFGDFMDYARNLMQGKLLDSDRVAKMFRDANKRKNIEQVKEHFEEWYEKSAIGYGSADEYMFDVAERTYYKQADLERASRYAYEHQVSPEYFNKHLGSVVRAAKKNGADSTTYRRKRR